MQNYINEYLDYLDRIKGVSREYHRIVNGRLLRFMQFLNDNGFQNPADINRDMLIQYQDAIMKKGLSVNTKRDELLAIALFSRFIYDYGYIKENFSLVIDPPKKTAYLPRGILGEQEIAYLLRLPNQSDLVGIRDYCIMSLLYSSMMRTKELFSLKLSDIDMRLKQIIVRRSKNKTDRIVHIDGYTACFIKKYLKTIRPWLLKGKISDNLFISATGSDLKRGSFAAHFTRRYAPIIKEKFKKDVTPYSFRHSSATHWLDSGAKQKRDVLPYIQRQLGHESLESTAIYTHVAIEPLREMFKKYHPRDLALKKLHTIPSPEDIILPLQNKRKRGTE